MKIISPQKTTQSLKTEPKSKREIGYILCQVNVRKCGNRYEQILSLTGADMRGGGNVLHSIVNRPTRCIVVANATDGRSANDEPLRLVHIALRQHSVLLTQGR